MPFQILLFFMPCAVLFLLYPLPCAVLKEMGEEKYSILRALLDCAEYGRRGRYDCIEVWYCILWAVSLCSTSVLPCAVSNFFYFQ